MPVLMNFAGVGICGLVLLFHVQKFADVPMGFTPFVYK